MQFVSYRYKYQSRYNNVSVYDLLCTLEKIFPKLGIDMSFGEFKLMHGGFATVANYPEGYSLFDILMYTLINLYKVDEYKLDELFDEQFKEQDERLFRNIQSMISNYLPYLQKNSDIQKIAKLELGQVKTEYHNKINIELRNSDKDLYYALAPELIKRNKFSRTEYYDFIRKNFSTAVEKLKRHLQMKNYNNVEYIALEIIMLILIEDFNYPNPTY